MAYDACLHRDPDDMSHEQLVDTIYELRDRVNELTGESGELLAICDRFGLTMSEGAVLRCLMARPGVCLTKEALHLAACREDVGIKIIDVYICKIRRKLLNVDAPIWIETVWGYGYKLAGDMQAAAAGYAPSAEG